MRSATIGVFGLKAATYLCISEQERTQCLSKFCQMILPIQQS